MPNNDLFRTNDGQPVPAITAAEMKRVDDIAVADFGLSILQMMENAGRTLAEHALRLLGKASGSVTILAGGGGNGGGGSPAHVILPTTASWSPSSSTVQPQISEPRGGSNWNLSVAAAFGPANDSPPFGRPIC